MEALQQLYGKNKENYADLIEKTKSIDYQKLIADAQKVATDIMADITKDPQGAASRYAETATETANSFGKEIEKGVTRLTDTLGKAMDPEAQYQKTHWFNALPPKKNLMNNVFNQMDYEKGVRTSGKIRIEYTDRSTGKNVQMYLHPSSLKYLSTRNPADLSKGLTSGKEIRGVVGKQYWGRLRSRKTDDTGWDLDNGKHVQDATFDVKWEVNAPHVGQDTFHDGDGEELFGDYDSLWFKTAPPQSNAQAFELYNRVDLQESISTDGFFRGKIALLYHDKNGNFNMGYFDFDILQYMTQKDPMIEVSRQLSVGTEVRGIINRESWGKLASRRSDDDGWDLDNGRHVLDVSYTIKWEIAEPMSEEDIE
jgi:hypothetical protein